MTKQEFRPEDLTTRERKSDKIFYVLGTKDNLRRAVDKIPHTTRRIGQHNYVDCFMRVNGKLVRQTIIADRIQSIKRVDIHDLRGWA